MPEEEEDQPDPCNESGPFCVHWGEVGCCDRPCLREGCRHRCGSHDYAGCHEEGCACAGLVYEAMGEIRDLKDD